MTGQASVVEQVAEELYRLDHTTLMGGLSAAAGWAQRRYRQRADALAAAGLLASGPTLPVGPTRESEAEHAAMCDREEAHERRVRAAELRAAADRLLAGLDENPLLRGLVSINGGAQAMRDYAVESLREDAARIGAEGGGR